MNVSSSSSIALTKTCALGPPLNVHHFIHSGHVLSGLSLDSASTLQEAVQLALLSLEVRITTNVFLGDEDIGHAALAGDFFEGILNGGTVL